MEGERQEAAEQESYRPTPRWPSQVWSREYFTRGVYGQDAKVIRLALTSYFFLSVFFFIFIL